MQAKLGWDSLTQWKPVCLPKWTALYKLVKWEESVNSSSASPTASTREQLYLSICNLQQWTTVQWMLPSGLYSQNVLFPFFYNFCSSFCPLIIGTDKWLLKQYIVNNLQRDEIVDDQIGSMAALSSTPLKSSICFSQCRLPPVRPFYK